MAYLFYSRFWQQTSDIWLFALVVNSLRYHLYFISFIKFSRAHPIVLFILCVCVCARTCAHVYECMSECVCQLTDSHPLNCIPTPDFCFFGFECLIILCSFFFLKVQIFNLRFFPFVLP